MGGRGLEGPGAAPRRGEGSGLPGPLAPLWAECELVSQLVLGLSEEDFAKPTRLPAWNVKQLFAHIYRAIDRINAGLDNDAPAAADADSVSYWRMYDPVTDSAGVADRATELAAEYESGQQLAAAWDAMWRRVLQRAADEDPERLVVTFGPALELAEYVRTRVLELTIHRMDLHRALGLPPDPTEDALTVTEEILLGLIGPGAPRDLPWGGAEFVEKATGREPLTDEDRQALGDLADRFPLLA